MVAGQSWGRNSRHPVAKHRNMRITSNDADPSSNGGLSVNVGSNSNTTTTRKKTRPPHRCLIYVFFCSTEYRYRTMRFLDDDNFTYR